MHTNPPHSPHRLCSAHHAGPNRAASLGLLAGVLLAALLAMLDGCAGASAKTGLVQGPAYPRPKHQTRTLDIQVFRGNTKLRLTNTTAHAFGPCTLWLNAQFSRPIDGLEVGQTLDLPLRSFRDEYGDVFRGGGFFAAVKPETLVLAQLEVGDELLGLVVINQGEQ